MAHCDRACLMTIKLPTIPSWKIPIQFPFGIVVCKVLNTHQKIIVPNRSPALTSDWNTEWREIWVTSLNVGWGLRPGWDHHVSSIQVPWGNFIAAIDRYGV
jgi:hypothetical protein